MLPLSEIQAYYPVHLHHRGEFLIREYLQYKILELLFESNYALKFSFLGGTCLRIVHNNNRFSEDMDFDNFDLSGDDFAEVSVLLKKGLEQQGFQVEIRNVLSGAYHCYIRFPGLLYASGLSGHREAKIRINLDTEPQGFPFEPTSFFLNRFDVFTTIRCTPIDLLLSQKIVAMTQRRRPQGRDFYDAVFLFPKTAPDFSFLQYKLQISNPNDLKAYLLDISQQFDFRELAKDVQPFLFDPRHIKRVELFPEYMQTLSFGP